MGTELDTGDPWGLPGGSLGVDGRSLGDPWGVPGSSLGGPWGLSGGSLWEPGGPGTGPAPGTPKVPKVCNCRQKQARGQTGQDEALPDFGTP